MQTAVNGFNNPVTQLLLLEERVRLSGSTLPRTVDEREQWTGVRAVIDGMNCVLRLDEISEVIDNRSITPVPGCAAWVKGAMNLRGRLLPVFTIAACFDLPNARNSTAAAQIIVVEKPGIFCGILVAKVFGMQKFFEEEFAAAASLAGDDTAALELNNLGRMAYFVTARTSIDEQPWYRLDFAALAAELCNTDPGIKPADATTV